MNDLYSIVSYFKNILDVPSYYIIESNYRPSDVFSLYGHIGNIDIYIYNLEVPNCFVNDIINSRLLFTNGIISYELLLPIDNYTLLVINDIIKYFKGDVL